MTTQIVSVHIAASAYPKYQLHGRDLSYVCLIHAAEVQVESPYDVLRVLCGRVKPESVLPDASLYDRDPITCPTCKRKYDKVKKW